MSGEATTQILESTIDRDGLSIVTSTKTIDNPRLGAIYNPLTLAAAVPVCFQPLADGTYLALFAKRWTQATIAASGGPQAYSAHTEVTTPSWAIINPVTGSVSGQAEVPTRLSGARVLMGACVRTGYLFTVGTIDDVPFIQHHRVDDRGTIVLQSEEILQVTVLDDLEISWLNGVYIDGNYLVVIGTDDSAGGIYRRRKPWGRVGQTVDPWEYKGAKGWYSTDDPSALQPEDPEDPPLPNLDGARMLEAETPFAGVLTAATAVSYAKIRDREWLCTNDGTTARFWVSRMVEPTWRKSPIEVSADVVYLQPQLYYNPTALPDGVTGAVPYVATKLDSTSGKNALQVSWGALPV